MIPIDLNTYRGKEKDIVEKYLDADLMNKDALDSKNARFALGIGMPEARALQKRTNGKCKTFRDQMTWFTQRCNDAGKEQAQSEVQQAVCSSQGTAKLISFYVLASQKLGNSIPGY